MASENCIKIPQRSLQVTSHLSEALITKYNVINLHIDAQTWTALPGYTLTARIFPTADSLFTVICAVICRPYSIDTTSSRHGMTVLLTQCADAELRCVYVV